jgi:CBS domain-containing protein
MKSAIAEVLTATRGRTLYYAEPDASVADTVREMCDREVGAICVIGDTRLVGIFTERDLMKRVVAAGLDPEVTLLTDVMTPDPVCVTTGTAVGAAMQVMEDRGLRHLPVVEEDRLIGMVSLRDLTEFLVTKQQGRIDDVVGTIRTVMA